MWGIIPAAGKGSRIQPLAFSKELLPVGSRIDGDEIERPRAVSEYLVERMLRVGVDKLCFVIGQGKSDILEYYGSSIGTASITYVVQAPPAGLCDAIFRPLPFIGDEEWVVVGLPDTIWFPVDGLCSLADAELSFLLFPVEKPELFDAVAHEQDGKVSRIYVKDRQSPTEWVWGAFKARGRTLRALHELWRSPGRGDEYIGTLVNAYLGRGGSATAVRAGRAYVDVGTFNGYREAVRLLDAVKLLEGAHILSVGEPAPNGHARVRDENARA